LSLGGYCARSIENGLHWVLDVAFREDESRTRAGHAGANLGLPRRVAVSLLKRAGDRGSIQTRRLRAGWDDEFLLRVLQGILNVKCVSPALRPDLPARPYHTFRCLPHPRPPAERRQRPDVLPDEPPRPARRPRRRRGAGRAGPRPGPRVAQLRGPTQLLQRGCQQVETALNRRGGPSPLPRTWKRPAREAAFLPAPQSAPPTPLACWPTTPLVSPPGTDYHVVR
jgi:hypothetical protein